MKIIEWTKIFNKLPKHKYKPTLLDVSHNNQKISNTKVFNFKLHSDTYKRLRTFKTPQYENAYLMRRKKGFNTFLFRQNYDVIVTDKSGVVIEVFGNLEPNYISKKYNDAFNIFFFVVGTINFYEIKNNDRLTLNLKMISWV